MKLSTRGRYGTRALLELASRYGKGLALLKDIAEEQQISPRYLEHIIRPLVAGGILRTTRGTGGGIALARNPKEIKMSEIIYLLEGSIAPTDCVENHGLCDRADNCTARDIWCEVQQAMNKVLESITLQDMVERQSIKNRSAADLVK